MVEKEYTPRFLIVVHIRKGRGLEEKRPGRAVWVDLFRGGGVFRERQTGYGVGNHGRKATYSARNRDFLIALQ